MTQRTPNCLTTLRALIPVQGQRDEVMSSLKRIKTATGRAKEGLYLVEGSELCRRAIRYGARLQAVICTEGFGTSEEGLELRAELDQDCPVYVAHQGLIAKLLDAKPTPSCLALVQRKPQFWSDLIDRKVNPNGLWIGVDRGELADNLGMLLRSAEASAVQGVLLGNQTVDPFGRKVVRGSRGAVFSMPMAIEDDMVSAVQDAKNQGIRVISTSANTDQSYTSVDFTLPSLLIVGNEHHGVSDEVLALSDHCVKIPMLGQINSLNIAVAASIVLFEANRQRRE